MAPISAQHAHLVVGGFPPGSHAGHDMDSARRHLLELLGEHTVVTATISSDFSGIENWLQERGLLITYVAGPYLDAPQSAQVEEWLASGGRWLALHGTSGGKSARLPDGTRKVFPEEHHALLGSLFTHHPPLQRFQVDVVDRDHPLTRGLPASFEIEDELYFIKPDPDSKLHFLFTTVLPEDPTPESWPTSHDHTESLLPDGKTRLLGYTKDVGQGGIAYIAMGHCHSPTTNMQPFVDVSISPDKVTPELHAGPWETDAYKTLLRNAIEWGLSPQNGSQPAARACFMLPASCDSTQALTLYEQDPDGTFRDISDSAGLSDLMPLADGQHIGGLAAGDLDQDGDLDVYVAEWQMNLAADDTSLLLGNNGDGSFSDVTVGSGVDGTKDEA